MQQIGNIGHRFVSRYPPTKMAIVLMACLTTADSILLLWHAFGWDAGEKAVDWVTYYAAANLLVSGLGAAIYDPVALAAAQLATGQGLRAPYPYHPLYPLVALPFALMPPGIGQPGGSD